MSVAELDVYGAGVRVESDDGSVIAACEHDFHFFLTAKSNAAPRVRMTVRALPSTARPSGWRVLFRGPKSTIFRSPGDERRVCFFEKAWVSYKFIQGMAEVYCDDPVLSYEVLHLVILSFMGEAMDLQGTHRIHGLGVAFEDEGMIFLAASGTGKSTLGLELLRKGGLQILSDDTPGVTLSGRMVAIPLRIALAEKPPIEERFVRTFHRSGGKKHVVSAAWFADRVRPSAKLRWIVELRRGGEADPRFTKASRLRFSWLIFKWLVVGYETPQIWELFVRFSARDVFAKSRIFFHRLAVAARMLATCELLQFHMSDDPIESAAVIRQFGRQAS